jgi:hypothetical protein
MHTEAISPPFLIKRDLNDFPTNRSRRTWHKAATPLSSADEAIHDAGIAMADSQQKQATEMVAKHGSADVSGIGDEAESMTAR